MATAPQREGSSHSRFPVLLKFGLVCYALGLAATLSSSSLWTDEAFSAYLACQKNLVTFWQTICAGDSSDLQMIGYYFYLFIWKQLWGASELSLRAANIPFLLLLSASLVWTVHRVFHSRWSWLTAAAFPFTWAYASEARPYAAVLACSSLAYGALLVYLSQPTAKERRILPWVVIGSLFAGALFHMLLLLVLLPILVLWWGAPPAARQNLRRDWASAALGMSLPFFSLGAYFAFTFLRGTAYDYPAPTVSGMLGLLYSFSGLGSYGPNRIFSVDYRPYATWIWVSLLLFATALTLLLLDRRRDPATSLPPLLLPLSLLAGVAGACALSFLTRQQLSVRHLATLVPVLLYVAASFCARPPSRRSRLAAILLCCVWLGASLRLTLPENQKEDWRGAVFLARQLSVEHHAEWLLVADPVAPAYYGSAVSGQAPCYPIPSSCQAGFQSVTWPRHPPVALDATRWSAAQIRDWFRHRPAGSGPVLILQSRQRTYRTLPWWALLSSQPMLPAPQVHGFAFYLLSLQ